MRRVLVIVLALLFPLNVFALSMSASVSQASIVPDPVGVPAAVEFEGEAGSGNACALGCDLDSDEPPGHQDPHDIVNLESAPAHAGLARRAAFGHDAGQRCHCPPPPIEPPRA